MSFERAPRNEELEPGLAAELVQLRQRTAELEILYDTIQDVASTLSVHEVVGRLLDRTLIHLHSELGSILLLDGEGGLRIMLARGLPEDVARATRIRVGEGISGFVASSGEPLLVRDIESDPRFRRRNHERYYTSSLICAPIVLQGAVRGVINVNNKKSREPFQPADLRLLEAIAAHAAVALGNAHRFEEMRERAQRDALTGLANHGHFWASLDLELKRAERYKRPVSLVLIDVDHFKLYNDRHGHLGGDRALVEVANAIAARSRAHDVVARYGGEEFAVILPETRLEGALTFGEKIRMAVEETGIGAAHGAPLTVSVGVACAAQSGATPSGLVQEADAQLYRAKSSGRNRVCG